MTLLRIGLVIGALAWISAPGSAAPRRIALVLDTSGSMVQNDPQRYTVQATKILADLVGDDDALDAVRIPGILSSLLNGLLSGGPCAMQADRNLALTLLPGRRLEFKDEIDSHVQYGGGTHFAAPLRTAAAFLNRNPAAARMLLVVADEGGLGECGARLTRELLDLRNSGALVAQIHLGSGASAFRRNPAFDFTHAAPDAHALLVALAQVYQRFIGGEHVQTGPLHEEFSVQVLPGAREAFVVVALDGELADAEVVPGHPDAVAIDTNFRGGGFTMGLDGVQRSYRIVRLLQPAAGRWRFRLYGAEGRGGWLLIQDYGTTWERGAPHPPVVGPGPPSPREADEPAPPRVGAPGGVPGVHEPVPANPESEGLAGAVVYAPIPAPEASATLVSASSAATVVHAVVRFPRLGPRAQATATLDLTNADLQSPATIALASDLTRAGAALEIRIGDGWRRLGREPMPVALPVAGPRSWPLRLWTGRCPEACSAAEPHAIDIVAAGPSGERRHVSVPVSIELVGTSRLRCYGPTALGILLLAVGLVAGYMFLAPQRSTSRRAVRRGA